MFHQALVNLFAPLAITDALRRLATLWGETAALRDPCLGPARPPPGPAAVSSDGTTTSNVRKHHGLPASTQFAPLADEPTKTIQKDAALAPEPSSVETEGHINTARQSPSAQSRQGMEVNRGRGQGHAARRAGDRRRPKPAVVREICLFRDGTRGVLLLADGTVWWMADLADDTWQPVTAPPSALVGPTLPLRNIWVGEESAACFPGDERPSEEVPARAGSAKQGVDAADGASLDEVLPSRGVSAVAIVRVPRQEAANRDPGPDGSGKRSRTGGGQADALSGEERGTDELAIVAGRDDGWLFLLTQGALPSGEGATLSVEGAAGSVEETGDCRLSLRPWRVRAAWNGHRSRVTSLWVVGDCASIGSARGNATDKASSSFVAALDTSRLNYPSDVRHAAGALISAGANGTVAWWEWTCVTRRGSLAAGAKDERVPPPTLRMVRESVHSRRWSWV